MKVGVSLHGGSGSHAGYMFSSFRTRLLYSCTYGEQKSFLSLVFYTNCHLQCDDHNTCLFTQVVVSCECVSVIISSSTLWAALQSYTFVLIL